MNAADILLRFAFVAVLVVPLVVLLVSKVRGNLASAARRVEYPEVHVVKLVEKIRKSDPFEFADDPAKLAERNALPDLQLAALYEDQAVAA